MSHVIEEVEHGDITAEQGISEIENLVHVLEDTHEGHVDDEHLDELLGDGICDIIYTGAQNDEEALRKYHYSGEKQKEIVRRFKQQDDPLKILLVC